MDNESTVLSEMSQTETQIPYHLNYKQKSKNNNNNNQAHRYREQNLKSSHHKKIFL